MLTKYILTIEGAEHPVPEDCLKNWDEISFSLKRTDYSGVMRSFSTQFEFCGAIADLLRDEYLDKGFDSSASVAVYTITNTHTWEKQFEESLDFSSLEDEDGIVTINALDNTIAAKIKSLKSQKYEFKVSDLSSENVLVERMELKNACVYSVTKSGGQSAGPITMRLSESRSAIISSEYLEMVDQVNDDAGKDANSFFCTGQAVGASLTVRVQGVVRCFYSPTYYNLATTDDVPVSTMTIWTIAENADGGNDTLPVVDLFNNDITRYRIHGVEMQMQVGGSRKTVYHTYAEMVKAAGTPFNGLFGVVSANEYGTAQYFTSGVVWEWQNGSWHNMGAPADYYQDRDVDIYATVPSSSILIDTHIRLAVSNGMYFMYGTVSCQWADPIKAVFSCAAIKPVVLLRKVMGEISPGTAVAIADDEDGLLANTLLLPAESLRQMSDAHVYTTFSNFASWMEAVFGYTYRVDGNKVEFVHRSVVFPDEVTKNITSVNDVKYSVQDNLLYSQVTAGYSKKEYGEIDGRYEYNFSNYYTTGLKLTDKKLELVSKYRADSYGIEFTARKSNSESTDDKSDEDLFFAFVDQDGSSLNYAPANNAAYKPSVCVQNNGEYIAAFGNGRAVTLTMTSSDGDNDLENIDVIHSLFTAGEVEFTTDEMGVPDNLNGMIQFEHRGFRYQGFINSFEERFGRQNSVKYTLIVKRIGKAGTELNPKLYEAMEYVANTNSSKGIDTGLTMTADTQIEARFKAGDVSNYACLWCSRGANPQTDCNTVFVIYTGKSLRFDFGQSTQIGSKSITSDTDYSVKWTGSAFMVNGTMGVDCSSKAQIQNYGLPIGLLNAFFTAVGSGATTYPFTLPFYGCKIWQGGKIVRDFVPMRRISDGVAGLYDQVEDKFYVTVDNVELSGK